MLLFLDFDGVLHPASTTDPARLLCRQPLLAGVLHGVPDVDIVISSTWRETRTLAQLQALFMEEIAQRIVGATPRWHTVDVSPSLAGYRRQAEIQGWLNQHGRGWEPWVALDDQPWLFRPFLPNLIRVNPGTGLTAGDCQTLYRQLRIHNPGQ